ncbi:hypothetical protein CB1_000871009 [Camelus ferus]|nr:hypothetical protein CB1_000871009 [Camelus ferus]
MRNVTVRLQKSMLVTIGFFTVLPGLRRTEPWPSVKRTFCEPESLCQEAAHQSGLPGHLIRPPPVGDILVHKADSSELCGSTFPQDFSEISRYRCRGRGQKEEGHFPIVRFSGCPRSPPDAVRFLSLSLSNLKEQVISQAGEARVSHSLKNQLSVVRFKAIVSCDASLRSSHLVPQSLSALSCLLLSNAKAVAQASAPFLPCHAPVYCSVDLLQDTARWDVPCSSLGMPRELRATGVAQGHQPPEAALRQDAAGWGQPLTHVPRLPPLLT